MELAMPNKENEI